MNKKNDKIAGKVLWTLSIVSAVITFLEGLIFYNAEAYPDILFRGMLIIQNTIRSFGFKSDIGIEHVIELLQTPLSPVETVITYAYSIAIFTAPYCTLKVLYNVLQKVFQVRLWKLFNRKHSLIIFGYNDEVKAILKDYGHARNKDKKEKTVYNQYRIHLVADNISKDDGLQLLKNKVVVHSVDCLTLPPEQQAFFLSQMDIERARCIVFFHESSARNFSLYKMLHNEQISPLLDENVKFYCRCEHTSVQTLLEDFHDNVSGHDMEMFSLPELRIRKLLSQTPLHTYHLTRQTKDTADWDLHLLIIGFGKLGQQLLLQTMNQGVVSSGNRILVDVVDYKIEEKQSIFANCFHEDYVDIDQNSISISSDKADGSFHVRFHQMDVRYKQFYNLLKANGDPAADGPYTYVAICTEDEDVGVHCLLEIQRYQQHFQGQDAGSVNIAIRMEADKYMADYLNRNHEAFDNVVVIPGEKDVLTLEGLIHDELNADAKAFNRIYNSIRISDTVGQQKADEQLSKEQAEKMQEDLWRDLALFRRDSNRALQEHSQVKEAVFAHMMQGRDGQEELKRLFGENGSLLKDCGDSWVYENGLDDFVEKQSDRMLYPCASEISRMEHRRWCYFMASRGWRRTEAADLGKARKELDREKKNICMCTWDDLVRSKKDTCQYDLMWLLKKYKEMTARLL